MMLKAVTYLQALVAPTLGTSALRRPTEAQADSSRRDFDGPGSHRAGGSLVLDGALAGRARQIFRAVLDREPEEWDAFLDQACNGAECLRNEVESLLEYDRRAGSVRDLPEVGRWGLDADRDPRIGRRIGPYQVLRRLGRGGMSVVYLALRADDEFQKRVALKLLQPGQESEFVVQRLRAERQILASLEHPNIAQLLDGGSTEDGLPYLVMEYVEGQPIDEYCDRQGLSLRERIELFRDVCSAVHFAHQNLVVHRDLKPANILVTADGRPKLLDFGIAKLLNPELSAPNPAPTTAALRMMTPDYASPEQVRGEPIATSSDVYSLGVLLYKLLTGRQPYHPKRGSPVAMVRLICQQEPERPSSAVLHEPEAKQPSHFPLGDRVRIGRRLAGDLDNVVLMALRKEPRRRYASVEQLSEDLRRYLEGHPVVARKAGLFCRGCKFARRHLWALTATLAIVALTALAVASLAIVGARRPPDSFGSPQGPVRSIAVLPLADLSADSGQEYFAVGMTEALINRLAKLGRLRVISKTSVMRYHDTTRSLPEIARELDVEAVLEGSVLRAGNRIRVTLQLIRARGDEQLWAEEYERPIDDMLGLQGEIAQAVAANVQLRLTEPETSLLARTEAVDSAAYRHYLRGLFHSNRRTIADLEASCSQFRQAIALDPAYAPAYARLADSMILLSSYYGLSPVIAFPQARQAAQRALAIDSTLPEAYASLGAVQLALDWDFEAAALAYRRALELGPGYATAHQWYGELLSVMGRHEEAVAEGRLAWQLDPLSPIVNAALGQRLSAAGRWREALEQFAQSLDLEPRFAWIHREMAYAHAALGEIDLALAERLREMEVRGIDTQRLAELRKAVSEAGMTGFWRWELNRLQRRADNGYVPALLLAEAWQGIGEREQALEDLERAVAERGDHVLQLTTSPELASLALDPRASQLLTSAGLSHLSIGKPQSHGGHRVRLFPISVNSVPLWLTWGWPAWRT